MTLNHDVITGLAPDQASLKAANGLMKAKKWPVRAQSEGLVWGECQGSGANPYRTVFDAGDQRYKCTCPSRKFPCKHVLALMWMYVESAAEFEEASHPDWVTDWLGRRRATRTGTSSTVEGKSLAAAQVAVPEAPPEPEVEKRRAAAAAKRAETTDKMLLGAVDELERWIADQLRTGLDGLLGAFGERCRAIAARLVDGRARAMAGRLDEMPGRILALPAEARPDALIRELGRIVLILRAFRAAPKDPELRGLIEAAVSRETVTSDPGTLRVRASWEVLGEEIATRRDGMISHSTWLMNLDRPGFALLYDVTPPHQGRRSSGFSSGQQFTAEVIYYPARVPLRAVISDRDPIEGRPWPACETGPMDRVVGALGKAPWHGDRLPVLLPPGRVVLHGKTAWWQPEAGPALPLGTRPPDPVQAMDLRAAAGLWHGRLTLLAAQSNWGRIAIV